MTKIEFKKITVEFDFYYLVNLYMAIEDIIQAEIKNGDATKIKEAVFENLEELETFRNALESLDITK